MPILFEEQYFQKVPYCCNFERNSAPPDRSSRVSLCNKGARCSSVVRAFAHGAMGRRIKSSLSYFSFQPVLHDWYKEGRGMCYPVCGMMHIKEPLLLIGKSSLCGGSGFPPSQSEWSFTICMTPYNRKMC